MRPSLFVFGIRYCYQMVTPETNKKPLRHHNTVGKGEGNKEKEKGTVLTSTIMTPDLWLAIKAQ